VGILGWIVVGLIAGGLARRAVGTPKLGCLGTMAVGIIGAIIGGALFSLVLGEGITKFNLWTILVAFVGACLFLFLISAFAGGRRR
jgi:uncharacterized membrane protein YeaQ/YmgE (transglycosylase-associated protein family)